MKRPKMATSHLQIPPESALLRAEYESSGLTIADLTKATSISAPAVRVAVNGFRYYEQQRTAVVPPTGTVVKLAAALGIDATMLRAVGRDDAAAALVETPAYQLPTPATRVAADEAATVARQVVLKQVLAAFSSKELLSEVDRRKEVERKASLL